MVELGEDVEGLAVGVGRGPGLAAGLLGVAEVAEDLGLVVPGVELAEQLERAHEAARGLGVLPEVVAGAAHAVPGGRFAEAVTQVAEELKGGQAPGEALFVVAELGVDPADRVERVGLPGPVARGLEQLQRLSRVRQPLVVLAFVAQGPGQVE